MVDPIRVLCVDAHDARRTARRLEDESDRMTVETSSSVDGALDRIAEVEYDGIVSKYDLPDRNGIAFLETVREERPDVPFVLFTGKGNEEIASEAISADVTEYVRMDRVEVDAHEVLAERLANAVSGDGAGRSERGVRQSPEQLLERISDVFISLDDEWRFIYANEAAEGVFGKPAGELYGENIWEVAPEAMDTPFYDHYHEAMAKGESRTIEEYYEPWDRWYREHIYPTERGLAVIFRDITEQKRRENKRGKYRRRMELALEKTDSLIFEVNLETGEVSRQGLFEQFFDVPSDRAETLESFVDHAVHPEDRERFRRVFEELRDGETETAEIEFRTPPDGARVEWVSGDIFVKEDDGSRRAIGLARNVTEHKAYETQIREEQQFVKSVFESLPDPLYAFDTDGYLLRWNEELEETTGYDADEIEEMYVTDFVPDDRREVIVENFEHIISERRSVTVESAFETIAGEQVPFEFTGAPLEDADGNLRGVTGVGRDVTERKRREDRIGGLNDALGEFIDAEGEQDICNVAIESARTTFDLPVAAIALFDDDLGSLRLTAQTPAAQKRLEVRRLLEQDGVAWRAFTSGEPIVLDSDDFGESDLVSSGPINRLAVCPLGRHGVFVASVRVDGTADIEMDFVRTIAENLRNALDRVERETLLREREAGLEDQNESLDQLNRINNVIRSIDRELVRASTRTEIEQAVCHNLTDDETYGFAWIGEYDPSADRIRPRESDGDQQGYLDTVTFTAGGAPSEEPAGAAVRTRKLVVVDDLLTDPPHEPWRESALKLGYRSCIAIPLTYRESLYGVLTLYANQPNLFDDVEREVLTELGETVAHAINAIECKRALVSDTVVELELQMACLDHPLGDFVEKGSDRKFEFEGIVPSDGGTYRVFYLIHGAPSKEFLGFVGQEVAFTDTQSIAEYEDASLFESTLTEESLLFWLLDRGAVPRSFTFMQENAHLEVELSGDVDIREFMDFLKAEYPDTKLLSNRKRERTGGTRQEFESNLKDQLTARQREALQMAYYSGYFASPRERTGVEMADSMDISAPTFSEHVRASLRNLLGLLYEDGKRNG